MQQVVKKRVLLCRMVKDNLDKTVAQSQKQNRAAETQSQSHPPEEPAGPEQSLERVKPDSSEPTGRQLDLLLWHKLNLEEEPEDWRQVSIQSKHTVNHSVQFFFAVGC